MSDRSALASARIPLLWTAGVLAVLAWSLRDLALIVGYSVLLAYALLPVVGALRRVPVWRGQPVSRAFAAALVLLALAALAGWLLALAAPRLASEAARFVAGAPDAAARLDRMLRGWADQRGMGAMLGPLLDGLRGSAAGLLQNLGGTLAQLVGRLLGGIGAALGLLLVPLLAFYLIADAEAVQASAMRFVPAEARPAMARLGGAVDNALRSYVRGQALVCLVMGTAVGLALALAGFHVALLLGVLVGFAELIPYLGFAVAALTIALTGLTASPVQALIGVAIYVAVNWAIGTFVTPRVMGRYLRMHPFVVTVSVLAGAKLLGAAGALLALPGVAVIQAIVAEMAPPAAEN